jgi:hypothetical protein
MNTTSGLITVGAFQSNGCLVQSIPHALLQFKLVRRICLLDANQGIGDTKAL